MPLFRSASMRALCIAKHGTLSFSLFPLFFSVSFSFKLLQYIIVNSAEKVLFECWATLIVRLSHSSPSFSLFLHTSPPPLSNISDFLGCRHLSSFPHSLHASPPRSFSYNTLYGVSDKNCCTVLYHYCTLSLPPQSTLQELKWRI